MTIRGILFDKDGTLLDYHATWMPLNWQAARTAANGNETLAERLMISGGCNPAVRWLPATMPKLPLVGALCSAPTVHRSSNSSGLSPRFSRTGARRAQHKRPTSPVSWTGGLLVASDLASPQVIQSAAHASPCRRST